MALGALTVSIRGPYANPVRAGANYEPQYYDASASNAAGPTAGSTVKTDQAAVTTAQTAVAAAVATLVADGATPTQAHVTTLNTAWGTLNTDINTVTSDVASLLSGNVVVTYDESIITSRAQLKAALLAALRTLDGAGTLTA